MNQELKDSILHSGTTIVGIVCKGGVVMAADRQTSVGNIVMHKDSEKARKINDYLVYSGCGLAAAIRRNAKVLAAELRLKELRSRSRPSVKKSANLLGAIIAGQEATMGALVAGFDEDGNTALYTIDPAGNITHVKDYDANFGSGMPYVLGLLERQYKKDLTMEEGIELAKESLKASTQRDMASGYGIDIYAITKDGIKKEVEQEIVPEYKDSK